MKVVALAHSNIALVKYWGKRDSYLNTPAVGSLSITLEKLWTKTQVSFSSELRADEFILNNEPSKQLGRVSQFLELVRKMNHSQCYAKVESKNNFPTAAGLASSASGFAALALASTEALNCKLSCQQLSILARQGSGSAARSIYGGFALMHKGEKKDGTDAYAEQLLEPQSWPLEVLIVITSKKSKSIGSTDGMNRTAETSPFYTAWLKSSDDDLKLAQEAVKKQDFELLANISEHSCLKMHALALAAKPGLIYWNGVTVKLLHMVRELRSQGLPVFFTVDAGPQVKLICLPGYAKKIAKTLEGFTDINEIIISRLGGNAKLIESFQ